MAKIPVFLITRTESGKVRLAVLHPDTESKQGIIGTCELIDVVGGFEASMLTQVIFGYWNPANRFESHTQKVWPKSENRFTRFDLPFDENMTYAILDTVEHKGRSQLIAALAIANQSEEFLW